MAFRFKSLQAKRKFKLKRHEEVKPTPNVTNVSVAQDGGDLIVYASTDYPADVFIDNVHVGKIDKTLKVNLHANPHLRLLMETEKEVEIEVR
ncbi:hypothetical protein DRO35_04580 [Candidatus Bathyarchaeota archaeon]|nr:MAG: hypothetical protein DRO35_04580 [Candidatus Bathyarchaeota archaeon]